ncbi:MAG TPA: hypothetical protein VFQ78_09320, partial [Candidatus Udaeobacter sp.]|nr:hypothetical protein [Candidatus Udaeobacter sp.]
GVAGVCATTLTLGQNSKRRINNRSMRWIATVRHVIDTQNVKCEEDRNPKIARAKKCLERRVLQSCERHQIDRKIFLQ